MVRRKRITAKSSAVAQESAAYQPLFLRGVDNNDSQNRSLHLGMIQFYTLRIGSLRKTSHATLKTRFA